MPAISRRSSTTRTSTASAFAWKASATSSNSSARIRRTGASSYATPLPEGIDPDRALDVANTSNRLLKAAKTVVYDGASVAFSVESFVSDTVELGRHFERSLSALRKAIGIFFERLETTAAAEPAPSEGEAT